VKASNARRRSVLLTDGNARGVLAAARTLAAAGFRVGTVAEARTAAAHWSRASSRRYLAPDPRAEPRAFVETLAGILERDGFSILISGSDAALRAISGFRTDLPALTRTGLPSREVVDAVLDKRRLMSAARAAGFAQPRSVSCATLDEARDAGRSIGYPLVVKPASTVFAAGGSLRQRSARLAPDEQALAALVSDCGSQCLVQERLEGQVLSLGGVLTEHGMNPVALARYERTWPPRAGNAGCATTELLPPGLVRSTQALLAGLGWQGLFELELIGTPDGDWVPVDLNPRPFGSLALASAAGAPLAVAWCRVLLGERPAPAVARPGFRYRWEEAELRHVHWAFRHEGVSAALDVLRPRRRTVHAYFSWRDPVPAVARALELAGRLVPLGATS
jgi:predicted ATP-grasp superfamily ATP-dependent carboligase